MKKYSEESILKNIGLVFVAIGILGIMKKAGIYTLPDTGGIIFSFAVGVLLLFLSQYLMD